VKKEAVVCSALYHSLTQLEFNRDMLIRDRKWQSNFFAWCARASNVGFWKHL